MASVLLEVYGHLIATAGLLIASAPLLKKLRLTEANVASAVETKRFLSIHCTLWSG